MVVPRSFISPTRATSPPGSQEAPARRLGYLHASLSDDTEGRLQVVRVPLKVLRWHGPVELQELVEKLVTKPVGLAAALTGTAR